MNLNLEEPIVILGFGTEGKVALTFLKGQGLKDITVCDQNSEAEVPKDVKSKLGKTAFDELSDYRTIVRSPGVQIDLEGIKAAVDTGAQLTSLTKLTLQVASDRITAVTGTNGKTTTTALAEKILRAHYGDRLIVGGNDRKPVLQQAIDRKEDPILLEASSFQFVDLEVSPYISAVLNITPNHLDWHKTIDNYAAAKANILRHQGKEDWAILNAADENSAKLQHATTGQQFWVNEKRGDHWAVWEDGYLKLSFDGREETALHWDQLNVKTHPDNILFAVAIGKLHMVPVTTIEEQIKLFTGVEHRLEYVRTLQDVHFYNDSSSTSPESTLMAITQFIPRKTILLLGGSSKNADFGELARKITEENVRVYLYGAEKQVIKESILAAGGEGLIVGESENKDFGQVVQAVYQLAKPEDSIVLSPACASFDMFKNAKARGQEFKQIVNQL